MLQIRIVIDAANIRTSCRISNRILAPLCSICILLVRCTCTDALLAHPLAGATRSSAGCLITNYEYHSRGRIDLIIEFCLQVARTAIRISRNAARDHLCCIHIIDYQVFSHTDLRQSTRISYNSSVHPLSISPSLERSGSVPNISLSTAPLTESVFFFSRLEAGTAVTTYLPSISSFLRKV